SSGNLLSVAFDLGTKVNRGNVVAVVDNTLLELRLEAAQLQQKKLQEDYARQKRLWEGDATTENALREIKYNFDNATNQVKQIEKQIADNQIKAAVSGEVVARNVEAGEFVNPGTVLGKLVDISRLKVDVKVTETEVYRLKLGQEV